MVSFITFDRKTLTTLTCLPDSGSVMIALWFGGTEMARRRDALDLYRELEYSNETELSWPIARRESRERPESPERTRASARVAGRRSAPKGTA